MKISVNDLEKALSWIKENTHAEIVDLVQQQERRLYIKCEDKYEKIIEITLYSVGKDDFNSLMKPTIKKTERL